MTSSGPADPGPAPAPRPRRGYFLPGTIALVVLVAIGVAVGAGDLDHSRPHTLHGTDVAQELALGIQAQQGSHALPDVRCPAAEPVHDGWQFTCQLVGTGPNRAV
ncbi:MAG TPA: DUF4333 domain-containing protein, partial [Acidimicrobiales bacterium]